MKEILIDCPRCGSNACSEISSNNITIWTCMGCGFTTNSLLNKAAAENYKEILPEIYKDLEFVDGNGLYWFPTSVVMDDKSMIFAEGTSIEDWKWSAIQSKNDKPDMTTKKEFNQNDFIEALDYVGYFNVK